MFDYLINLIYKMVIKYSIKIYLNNKNITWFLSMLFMLVNCNSPNQLQFLIDYFSKQ